MNKMRKYYLAHSCLLIKQVRRWELKIQGRYNVDLVNPFNRNEFENVKLLATLRTRKRLSAYMQTLDDEVCKKIVEHDLELLRKCDGLVAVFNIPTAGTMMEIFCAAWLYRVPVYIIGGDEIAHPWIKHMAKITNGGLFRTKRAFEKWLEEQGLRKEVI